MLDKDGYRLNVGIILLSPNNQVFWGKRKGESSWQFPQGGLYENEEMEQGMLRELNEELGLLPKHIQIIAHTDKWLYYDVPSTYNRSHNRIYRGQKQIWYLLRLIGQEYNINVKYHKEQEFDAWRWINYWEPIDLVIPFKHDVYEHALQELSKFLP